MRFTAHRSISCLGIMLLSLAKSSCSALANLFPLFTLFHLLFFDFIYIYLLLHRISFKVYCLSTVFLYTNKPTMSMCHPSGMWLDPRRADCLEGFLCTVGRDLGRVKGRRRGVWRVEGEPSKWKEGLDVLGLSAGMSWAVGVRSWRYSGVWDCCDKCRCE